MLQQQPYIPREMLGYKARSNFDKKQIDATPITDKDFVIASHILRELGLPLSASQDEHTVRFISYCLRSNFNITPGEFNVAFPDAAPELSAAIFGELELSSQYTEIVSKLYNILFGTKKSQYI